MNTNRYCVFASLLICFLAGSANGQNDAPLQSQKQAEQPATKVEAFLGKRGRLVLKDSYDLGQISSLGKIEMDALVIYEPGSSQKVKGLRVEVTEAGRLERSNTSFIDLDELQSLSEALSYMSNLAKQWNTQGHETYTEVIYSSKGQFKVGFFQKGKENGAFFTSGSIGAVNAFVKIADLDRLKSLVDQAISLLNSK